MNHRERAFAVLNYQSYDRLPIVHFGFWDETLEKWVAEGHLKQADVDGIWDGNAVDRHLCGILGFDFNWASHFSPNSNLDPGFEYQILEEMPDGSRKALNFQGVVILEKPGTRSIPMEFEHTLKTRADWEEHYKHRFQWNPDRVLKEKVLLDNGEVKTFEDGGLDWLKTGERDYPYGYFCGSLYGYVRDIIGANSTMFAEDPDLWVEIIDTIGELSYQNAKFTLEQGPKFDFGHFWEDICFKNGPLIIPSLFEAYVGPHYRRITDLLGKHGMNIVSLDCDGCIDALVPTWINNGVNTMFPIEVGTWDANIAPWRGQYGKRLRGVGGMNKVVFTRDRAAVDGEIARLKKLVDLGGYLPCPDHRIAPDSEYDLVRYYCDRMRQAFG